MKSASDGSLKQEPIAIIGLGTLAPKSRNVREFWDNVVSGRDCMDEVPPVLGRKEDYYDPSPTAPKEKLPSWRVGMLPEVDFDPLEFGIPPVALEAVSMAQLHGLRVAQEAMVDAGYWGPGARPYDPGGAGCIIGTGGLGAFFVDVTTRLAVVEIAKLLSAAGIPEPAVPEIIDRVCRYQVDWQHGTHAGVLPSVVAGRISKRFNFQAMSYVLEAACATALMAVKTAMDALNRHEADMILTGGVCGDLAIPTLALWSSSSTMSRTGICRPFDVGADGAMVSDGVCMFLLKRLADAERDEDHIYAVLRGVGVSSDGSGGAIEMPRSHGQIAAIRKAWAAAGCEANDFGMIEAHATSTPVGDRCELESLTTCFSTDSVRPKSIALGSIKSQVGHTRSCAGAMGLLKAVLSVHQKVLPPSINVKEPLPELMDSSTPFALNTQTRPWIVEEGSRRRAAINSFGFGGINCHAVIEEYNPELKDEERVQLLPQILVVAAPTPDALAERCEELCEDFAGDTGEQAYYDYLQSTRDQAPAPDHARIGLVAADREEAVTLLREAARKLRAQPDTQWQTGSLAYRPKALAERIKLAFIMTGTSRLTLGLGSELWRNHAPVRESFAKMEALRPADSPPLTSYLWPAPGLTPNEREKQRRHMTTYSLAQPVEIALQLGLTKTLRQMDLRPDALIGVSLGDLSTLWAADCLSEEDAYRIIHYSSDNCTRRGNTMDGALMGVMLPVDDVKSLLKDHPRVDIAAVLSPRETTVGGPSQPLIKFREELTQKGVEWKLWPGQLPIHTSLIAGYRDETVDFFKDFHFNAPKLPVYSNILGKLSADTESPRKCLERQMANPSNLVRAVQKAEEDGVQAFLVCGTFNFVKRRLGEILGEGDYQVSCLNPTPAVNEELEFRTALMEMRVAGVPFTLPVDLPEPPPLAGNRMKVKLYGPIYYSPESQARRAELLEPSPIPALAQTAEKEEGAKPQPVSEPGNAHEEFLAGQRQYVELISKLLRRRGDLKRAAPSAEISEEVASLEAVIEKLENAQDELLTTHQAYLAANGAEPESPAPLNGNSNGASPPPPAAAVPTHQANSTVPGSSRSPLSTPAAVQAPRPSPIGLATPPPSASGAGAAAGDVAPRVLAFIARVTGFPESMLDLSMEIENDLGVDSVRRVELLATLEEHFPAALEKRETIIAATTLADLVEALNSAEAPSAVDNPTAPAAAPPQTPTQAPPVPTAASATADTSPIAPAPPATSAAPAVSSARATTAGSDAGDVETQVLGLVAQITGFPRNMLDLSMNIEDDLGVDSVRRVELLATFEETFPAALEHREAILAVETLGDLVAALALAQKSGSTPTPAPRTTALPANASAGEELRASDSSQSLPLSLEPGQVPVHLDLDLAPAQAGEPASTLPPTTAAASADPASPASTSKLSTDPAVLEEQVLTLVASVTGFSRQMLDLTMDIEDDLGIDSVRRVELLAALEEAMPAALERRAAVMEARTLGDVVQVLSSGPTELPEPSGDASDHPGMPGSANAPAAPVEPAIAPAEQEDPESTDAGPLTGKVNRYAFQPVQLGELPDCAEGEITGGWMIGFDGSALAEALIAELKALGAKIHTVAYPGSSITADYVLPDLERETLDQAVQQAATACDGLRGFIHFEPAGEVAGAAESLADLAACRAAFLLAGSLEPVLLKAAEEGATPHFMTINPIAGNAGEEEPAGWHKLAGTGLPGLVKSLVREWSVVRGHALDVPSTLPVDTAARAILAELANPEQAAVDITLDAEGKRWTETPVELPKLTEPVPPIPDHDGVVLAVGGAYGVGAACAQRLAQAGASRFAVLGRTPLDEDDPEWARGITENAELQQRYIAHLRENQVRVTPVKVKRELDRLDKQRTIRATLARLREAGADARYYRADINDAGAVSSTINEVREELGTITDLLFIAGNVAPKRINLKTPADFDHVVGTKVTGLANLLAEFPAEQLRRLVLFSSIAARNGNHGQSDYCFANAVLSGFAAACQRMRPACRAVSIEWGAWNGGMFLPWKDRVVQRTNVTVFEPEEGAEFFLAEYAAESGGAPIVLVCGQADSSKTLAPEARDGAAELDPTTPRVTIEASYG